MIPLRRRFGAAGLLAAAVIVGSAGSRQAIGDEPKLEKLPPGLIRGPAKEILAIVARGRQLRNQGDRDAALAIFEESLQAARAAGDKSGEAWALNNIASVYRYEAADKRALEHSQRATALYENARAFALLNGDKHNAAYATLYLGVLAEQRGEAEQAMALLKTALPLFQEVSDPYYVARTYAFMGQASLERNKDPRQALAYFEQALPNFREAEVWHEAAAVLRDMFTAYEQLARPPAPKENAPDKK